jgi:NAD(P)-dependent dehydrogenase (short-subunit alcohol dehydrogenase family)
MTVRINPAAIVNGLPVIDMENEGLRVTVLLDLGAKIYDLVCKCTGRNFLWHNPRIGPHRYAIESNFDNHWCGGCDEGFPTCDECDHGGEHYPNLGELRSACWQVASAETAGGNAVAELTTFGPISPVRARKVVILKADQPVLTMQYGIENLGPLCLDFIWGTHPALNPSERMLLRIPAKTGFVGQAPHPSLGEPGQRYPWPILDTPSGTTDVSRTQQANAGVFCGGAARGGKALFVETDVSQAESVQNLVRRTLESFSEVHVLLNNAAIQVNKTVEETTVEEWNREIAINIGGVFLCSKFFLPHLRKTRGNIISMSSVNGFFVEPMCAGYCATKAAIMGLTKAMAIDHGKDGIRVNCICPGYIDAGLAEGYFQAQPDPTAARAAAGKLHALARIGRPEEVGRLAVYLASDDPRL